MSEAPPDTADLDDSDTVSSLSATSDRERGPEMPEPLPEPDADPAEQLAHIIPALWRTLTRATRAAQELPALESQVSILRMLVARGPLSPAQLADDLHLARPTVSNLLKGLVKERMIERRPSELDGRSVVILPTDRGRSVLETFRRDRAQVLRDALAALDASERAAVVTAVASLRGLIHELEETASADDADGAGAVTA